MVKQFITLVFNSVYFFCSHHLLPTYFNSYKVYDAVFVCNYLVVWAVLSGAQGSLMTQCLMVTPGGSGRPVVLGIEFGPPACKTLTLAH